MSLGNWLNNVALRGWLIAVVLMLPTLGLGQVQPQSEEAPTRTQAEKETIAVPESAMVRAIFDELVKIYTREKAANEAAEQRKETRDEAALIAQQDAARWAFWSMAVAVGALCASVATIGFIWLTFRETRRTADAAVDAADAARHVVTTDRAWIAYHAFDGSVNHGVSINGVQYPYGLMIRFSWQNAGKTPALDVDLFLQWKLVPTSEGIPTFLHSPNPELGRASMGPGSSGHTNVFALNPTEIDLWKNRGHRLFIYSRATYRDIFERNADRFTEVCGDLQFGGDHINPTAPEKGLQPIMNLMFVGPQNNAT